MVLESRPELFGNRTAVLTGYQIDYLLANTTRGVCPTDYWPREPMTSETSARSTNSMARSMRRHSSASPSFRLSAAFGTKRDSLRMKSL